jgi:hypothetical protein
VKNEKEAELYKCPERGDVEGATVKAEKPQESC